MMSNKMYYFISVPVAILFWLLLNYLFSGVITIVPNNFELNNMLASPIFIIMMVIAIGDVILLWKWVIPAAKKTKQTMLAYIFPEIALVLGFVVSYTMYSVTPYYYFLMVWIVGMAVVYKEVYSVEE